MIVKRVIDSCKYNHDVYIKDNPCSHCRYTGYTCEHTCKVLRVNKPLEYNQIIKVEYQEVKRNERFNKIIGCT